MSGWILEMITLISTIGIVCLWFHKVRNLLIAQKEMLDTAEKQFSDYRSRHICDRNDPEIAAILARSEHIYRQAVSHYNDVYYKSWVYYPAKLMGFHAGGN